MRIAVDTQSTIGRKTGIGQYTARLAAALRRVAPEHEYVEVSLGREVVMRTDRRLLWQQWTLPRLAHSSGADLLHVPGFDAPIRKTTPVVLTVHDLIGKLFPRNLPPVARFYWALWLPFTVQFAEAIIADSECTRRDITRLLRLPGERIHVIPLGVDEAFRPVGSGEVEAFRLRYGLPARHILYVGTLEPRKGIDTLIEAFARLAPRCPHHLVLAGKRGWSWQPLLKLISRRGLAERVRLLDYVPEADLPALYASADVFVFPSRYEGFGLPVLEAMACGTPVVCSDSSSLSEVAEGAAALVPPDRPADLAEAIESLLAEPGLRERMRESGTRRAATYTWEKTAEATIEVYRRVVGRS